MKKLLHHPYSINTILTAVFSLIVVSMVFFIGTAITLGMQNSMLNTSIDSVQRLSTQSQFTLNKYFLGINSSLQNLAQNKSLVEICKQSDEKDSSYDINNRNEVHKQILTMRRNNEDITNVIVLSDGYPLYHSEITKVPLMKSPLIQELLEQKNSQKYIHVTYHPITEASYYTYASTEPEIPVSIIVRDYSTYDTTNYGVLLVSLRLKTLNDFFKQTDADSGLSAFIVNDAGNIFYSTKQEWIGKEYRQYLDSYGSLKKKGVFYTDNSQKKIFFENTVPLELNNWNLVLTSDMTALNSRISSMKKITILCAIVSLVIIFILSYILTKRITAPLANLSGHMEKMDYQSLSHKMSSHVSYREINQLYTGYNHMLERIETLIDKVYYEQLRQKDAQYEALQAKINPHFLYNTLQSISSLAILGRNDDIESVSNALGEMLEYLTYEKNDQVPLSRELNYVKSYVQIQLLRYNNSFTATYEIEPATLSCRLSKLLLQPVVENAIKHGLEPKHSEGLLYIRTRIENDLLIIEVEDNGIGMDREALEKLIEKTNMPGKDNSQKSIGLSNVQERIHLKYGTDYGIEIHSILHSGTSVKIVIPAIFSNLI